MKKPLFTQEELKKLQTEGSIRRINNRLRQAQPSMRPLHFRDMEIHCQLLNFGLYRYHQGGIHRHPDLQLEYALSGRFCFFFGDVELELHAGQGLFIPPGTTHDWKTTPEPGSMLGVYLEIAGEDCDAFLNRMRKAQEQGKYHLASSKADSLIREILFCLARPRLPLGGIDEIAVMLDHLFIELIRKQCELMKWRPAGKPIENQNAERARQIAERAMRFLEVNHSHPVQRRDVALHVGVSIRHANRVFEAHYGTTINKALLQIRLKQAFQMLSDHPEYSIKAIAHDSGFSSATYFTRCFSQAYGIPPIKAQGR